MDRADSGSSSGGSQDMGFLKAMGAVSEKNFPGRVHRIVIYPCSYVFTTLWQVSKYLVDPRAAARVTPLNSGSDVFKYVDPEFVPVDIGGTCTYEPDIESLEEAPPMIHSLLNVKPIQKFNNRNIEFSDDTKTQNGSSDNECSILSGFSNFSFHTAVADLPRPVAFQVSTIFRELFLFYV